VGTEDLVCRMGWGTRKKEKAASWQELRGLERDALPRRKEKERQVCQINRVKAREGEREKWGNPDLNSTRETQKTVLVDNGSRIG